MEYLTQDNMPISQNYWLIQIVYDNIRVEHYSMSGYVKYSDLAAIYAAR